MAELKEMYRWLRLLRDSPHADSLILRGGVLLRHLLPVDRPVEDLDLLALVSLDQAEAAIREISVTDKSLGEVMECETIWGETPWPGLRLQLPAFQLDLGYADPLVSEPMPIEIGGSEPVSVLAVSPEVLFGWKAHGLFERGPGKWRAKDLMDLYLMNTHLSMDEGLLSESIAVAFSSRNMQLDLNDRFFSNDWGCSKGSIRKWRKFGRTTSVTQTLPEVRAHVAQRLFELGKVDLV
jgi:hypothetical protein